ncbi:uncharacterized protein [Physcomitrium patens]|uniref:uncharacterized protein isoform X2 n=1 Tax=Physcomitrium patens TaxID=3218 RepID=UPI003CCE3887
MESNGLKKPLAQSPAKASVVADGSRVPVHWPDGFDFGFANSPEMPIQPLLLPHPLPRPRPSTQLPSLPRSRQSPQPLTLPLLRPGAAFAAAASRQVTRKTSISSHRDSHIDQEERSRQQSEFSEGKIIHVSPSVVTEQKADDTNGLLKDSANATPGPEDFALARSVPEHENLVRVVDDASIVPKFRIRVIDEPGVVGEIESLITDEPDAAGKPENLPTVSNEPAVVERIESLITDGPEIAEKPDNLPRVFDEPRVVEKIESIVTDGPEVAEKLENLRVFDEPEVVGDPGISFPNNVADTSSNVIYRHEDHSYASSEISTEEELSDSDTGLISTNDNFNSDDTDEAVDALETNLEQKDDQIEETRQSPTAFQLAEELEMRNSSSGLHWKEGAAAQPMRLDGIEKCKPAIDLLQLTTYGTLSHALASPQLRREYGFPQAVTVHANFIAVGLSKGAVLVTPSKYSATRSADELESQKAFFLGGGIETKEPVSSLCFSHQGDLLLVGYANGTLRLWDVSRRSMSKMMSTEHSEAIVHTLFLGQEAPGARNLRVISGDCKGRLLLHAFSQQMVPLIRRFSVETQCLLEGDKTGPVLSVSPLLPDEGLHVSNGVNSSHQSRISSPPTLGSVMGGMGSVMGGMVGSVGAIDVGRKFLYDGGATSTTSATSADDGPRPMFVLVTHHTVLVVRLAADMQVRQPALEVMSKLSRPAGIRDGAIAYTAWRRIRAKLGTSLVSSSGNSDSNVSNGSTATAFVTDRADAKKDEGDAANDVVDDDDLPMLAMGWDTKMFIWQLTQSKLRKVREWELDSPAVGLAWLEEQMLVIVTAKDQLCLFTKEGIEVERGSIRGDQEGMGALIYHSHIMNALGNPEKAYHSSLSVRGAALYLMGPQQLWRARLLPWRERIKALEDAGDWMGAFHIAMELYDGRARGVTGLPRGLDAMREAIMSTLLALLSAYIDMAFAYLSVAYGSATLPALNSSSETASQAADRQGSGGLGQDLQDAREQYARVGGVAIEFCVHIGKQDVLFENVFSKFVAVGQRGIFLELLEPYILKDMLGGLAPEVMQALVEHYSYHGWVDRVEQCVLHMDIGSLDFNQVVRLCREHGLYSALIYLFNRGLDDFRSPLEELLIVADQASNSSQTQLVGYKLLVYLKYCFIGLAFPPGHGSLPTTRLPGLRAEILQFLLDQEGSIRGRPLTGFKSEEVKIYPRLWFLLQVDIQATLLVLRLAFPEHGPLGIGKQGFAYLTSADDEDLVLSASEDIHDGVRYVQATVNALVEILNVSHKVRAFPKGVDTDVKDSQMIRPSNEGVGYLLDFVAQFVASRHAVVSSATFMMILEYLALPTHGRGDALANEDLMVRLLNAVPDSNLDPSRTLELAQTNNFWQVSGLLHTRGRNYEAALDDYLNDENQIGQPFLYIMDMLDPQKGLQESDLSKFKKAVLLRISELVQRSSKGTLGVVLKHMSSDNQQVIERLDHRPELLFAYLKGIMNARSGSNISGELDSAGVLSHCKHQRRLPSRQHSTSSRFKRGNCCPQWDPNVDIKDLLQQSAIVFTDDMAELYVELLCKFEPHAVLKFLESYENYRLEHCLKLCQEYGITDAAIFLLERVGDVASALDLVLKDVEICRDRLELFVSTSSRTSVQAFDKDQQSVVEVGAVKAAVAAAVALCQRNTQRLEPRESITLWFRLLDSIVEPSKVASNAVNTSFEVDRNFRNQEYLDSERIQIRGKSRAQRKLAIKQAKDHGSHPFQDFRPTILNMLSAYGYERTILRTAKHLTEEDTFYNIYALRRGCAHGYAALSSICCICGLGLEDDTLQGHTRSTAENSHGESTKGVMAVATTSRSSNAFSIYFCGHAAHILCVVDDGSHKEDPSLPGCPVCSLKVKSSSSPYHANNAIWKGRDEASRSSTTPTPDRVAPYLLDTAIKSYHPATEIPRLAVLKQLQQGKQLSDLGPSLQLRLAPPPKIRSRRASVPENGGALRNRHAPKSLINLRR